MSVNAHGDELVTAYSLLECAAFLAAREIEWSYVVVDQLRSSRRDYRTGEFYIDEGIHQYFMRGDGDVAYWTPMMSWFHINAHRRPWSSDCLLQTRISAHEIDYRSLKVGEPGAR